MCEGKKSAPKKKHALVDLVCFSSPYPPVPQSFSSLANKRNNDATTRGIGPESPEAIHSDPDDGELVSVVKEALANLDHALLERHFLGVGVGLLFVLLDGG